MKVVVAFPEGRMRRCYYRQEERRWYERGWDSREVEDAVFEDCVEDAELEGCKSLEGIRGEQGERAYLRAMQKVHS